MSDPNQASTLFGFKSTPYVKQEAPKDTGTFWEKMGAGGYSALNEALMGLPDFLVKKVGGSDAYQKLQDLETANPTASGIGKVAGFVGPMLLPVGVGAKAVGTGLEKIGAGAIGRGLKAVGEVAEGARTVGQGIGSSVAKAGAAAALQAVPRAAIDAATTGDVAGALKSGALNLAGGTLLGAGLDRIAKRLPLNVSDTAETLGEQAVAGGMDVSSRSLKRSVSYGPLGKYAGMVGKRAEQVKDELRDLLIKDDRMTSEAGRKAFVAEVDAKWQKADDAWDAYAAPGGKVNSIRPEIMQDQRVIDAQDYFNKKGRGAEFDETLNKIINDADSMKDLASTRRILQKDYVDQAYREGAKYEDEVVAGMAAATRDTIDGHFVPDQLKADWARDKTIKNALTMEELKLPKATQAGSPTYARLAGNAVLGAATGGAGALGGDMSDPEQQQKVFQNLVLGGLIGGVGGRIGSNLINKGMARNQARLSKLLSKLTPGQMAKAQELISGAGGQAARLVGAGAVEEAVGGAQPAGIPSMPLGSAGPTMPGAEPQQAQPQIIPQLTPVPSQQQAPPPSPQEQGQAQFVSAGRPEATQPTNRWDAFKEQRLQTMYQRYTRYYGEITPYDQFKAEVMQSTNGLNPTLPGTWAGMFDDSATAKKAFEDYTAAQKLTGVDVGSALNHYVGLFGGALHADRQTEQQNSEQLVEAISQLTKQTGKEVEKRLATIASNKKLSPEKKKEAVVEMIVNEGGINLPLLKDMGLWS